MRPTQKAAQQAAPTQGSPVTIVPQSDDTRDWALAYAARGWHVFPCGPRAKTPLTGRGWQDATADPGIIRTWWSRWPSANVAIACGPSGLKEK